MIINGICSNISRYSVYHATKSAGIKAIFGGFRALMGSLVVGSKGAQMLGSESLEPDETKFWEGAGLDIH